MATAAERPQRRDGTPSAGGHVRTLLFVGLVAPAGALFGAALVMAASKLSYDAAPLVLVGLVALPILGVIALRRPYVAVLAVYAGFTVGTVTVLPSIQVVEVAVLGAAAVVALRRMSRSQTALPWATEFWWAAGLLAWTLVALPSATDNTLAEKQIAQIIAGLLFGCVVLAACRDTEDARRLAAGLLAIGAVIVAIGLLSDDPTRVREQFGGEAVEGRLTGSFSQPNQLGSFCSLVILVGLGLLFGTKSRRTRIYCGLGVGIVFLGLLLSYSRGAWIGLAVGAAVFVLLTPGARRVVLALTLPVLTLATVMGSFAESRPEIRVIQVRAESIRTRSPYDARSNIWKEAVREIQQSPVTGVGPGNFPVASTRAVSESSDVSADHAHNMWLNWAAEAGLPAAAILAAFCFALARAARAARKTAARLGDASTAAIVAGLAAALVSVVTQGMVDYTLRNAVNLYAIWAVIGILLVFAGGARQRA